MTDFTGLNRRIRRPIHPFPSPHDIISGLDPKSKVFAKLDALSGYHQVGLSCSASLLTTFLLPSGMYWYLRAPMGLSSSSDEFCRRSDLVFTSLPGIHKLVDDILVEATDLADLEEKLRLVFQRCQTHGFTLSIKKFAINTTVEFAGYLVSQKGILPCPRRLKAISEFPPPKDVSGLRSFLGLCNQLSIFVPNLASSCTDLCGLLKKNIVFQWLPHHMMAFNKIKSYLIKSLALHHFDSTLHTRLIMDASKLNGIGFVLLQTKDASSTVPIWILQCGS